MIRAVVFDMDGVLIDAKEWHYEAFNQALRLFGYEISHTDHLAKFDGLPTKKKLEILSLESDLPTALHSFINEMKQIYTMEIVYAKCRPNFAHEYALSRLKAAGYRLGVASNSIRRSVEIMMVKASLDDYLDVMLSNEDVILSKPNPEIYQRAMSLLNVAPNECLVVEDNNAGITAATVAGAHVMVVQSVEDVTLDNILNQITLVESKAA